MSVVTVVTVVTLVTLVTLVTVAQAGSALLGKVRQNKSRRQSSGFIVPGQIRSNSLVSLAGVSLLLSVQSEKTNKK